VNLVSAGAGADALGGEQEAVLQGNHLLPPALG
jgi:hypothetical protein